MFVRNEAGDGSQVAAPEELTIHHAAEAKGSLLELLDGMDEIDIDLAAVAEIDTAGLQLLAMARRFADANGKPFALSNHSQAVVEAMDLLNLAGYFGDPVLLRDQ